MKEITILMRELRNYPSNLFVYSVKYEDLKHDPPMSPVYGLVVCNIKGEEQGFINLGTNDGKVVL